MPKTKTHPGGLTRRFLRKKKGSSTPGRTKGLLPSPEDRIMAKRSRSYKSLNYQAWCTKYDGTQKVRKSVS